MLLQQPSPKTHSGDSVMLVACLTMHGAHVAISPFQTVTLKGEGGCTT